MSYDFDDFEQGRGGQNNNNQGGNSNQGGQSNDRGYPGQNGGQYQKPSYDVGGQSNQGQGGQSNNNQGGYQQQRDNQGQGGYQKRDYQDRNQGGQSNGGYNGNGGNNRYGGSGDRGGYGGGNRGAGNAGGGGFNKGGQGSFKPKPPDPNATLYLPYAVIGNDNPPPFVADAIGKFAQRLDRMGYTCRTGGMKGFEDLFEKAVQNKEVHLPWKDFDNKDSKFTYTAPDTKIIAARYQPGFEGLKPFIQSFLAKNVRCLMGKDLKGPALFLICWSEDGAESLKERTSRTGNAGHAIAIAHHLRIPIFNLGKEGAEGRLHSYLSMHEHENDPQPNQH